MPELKAAFLSDDSTILKMVDKPGWNVRCQPITHILMEY